MGDGEVFLAVFGFLSGDLIGAGGEGVEGGGGLSFFGLPDAGDAEEVGVKTSPEVVAEVEDDAARGEIVFGVGFAEVAGVENGGEEGEVGFDPGSGVDFGFEVVLGGGAGDEGGRKEEGDSSTTHEEKTADGEGVCQTLRWLI